MVRRQWASMLLTLTFMALADHLALAQPSRQDPGPEIPQRSFLDPAPKELLRRGMQPLSGQLPDTRIREGLRPPDASQGLFGEHDSRLMTFRGGDFTHVQFQWMAAELSHRPLYFEDAMLERHGQTRHPLVQPMASGARFFLTFPVLPYAMTVDRPCTTRSTLGDFRPGTCAPLLLQRPPLQADAGLVEAGMWVGLIFLIP